MKDLSTYPAVFLEIAERARKGLAIDSLGCIDEKAAISTRHRFNRFRKALAAQGHPSAPACSDLIVRIEFEHGSEKWAIKFLRSGLYAPGEEHADLVVPGLDMGPQVDHTEEALKGFLGAEETGVAHQQEGVLKADACAHEWDELKTRCVKCNSPYRE